MPPQQLQIVDGRRACWTWLADPSSVAYTPGHASHHVSYFDAASGVAWVGDTAGVCVDGGYVLPPTPPPDIDLPGWRQSIERHRTAGRPTRCSSRTAGRSRHARVHLRALAENLEMMAALARESLAAPGTDDERKAMFDDRLRRELRRHMDEAMAQSYESAAAFGLSWAGLARYLRRAESGSGS